MAQGLSAWEAALAGVFLHGLSGEMVSAEIGVSGGVAGDVADHLPKAMRYLRGE